MWKLSRERDGAGDQGRLLVQFRISPETDKLESRTPTGLDDIQEGWAVRVGADRATMFGADTYWTTTLITEILETNKQSIRFKTGNSIYTLREA